MKAAIVQLAGVSPYSQSRHYDKIDVPELKGEGPDQYERRTWRHRMHVAKDGRVFIPGMSFANGIKEAARRDSTKVKGKGNKTYTSAFAAGIMVPDDLVLPIKAADVESDTLFVPSDGIPGSGKRVTKIFPRIDAWSGQVTFYSFDDTITEDVFVKTLAFFGQLVGIGRFRPEKRGYYGRFRVDSVKWIEDAESMVSKTG